jgi:serine/alanine adding enzyme
MSYFIEKYSKGINSKNWKQFVNSNPNGNFFQSHQYIDFITGIDGYQPISLFALNADNNIEGILCGVIQQEGKGIKRCFSSRLIINGGPLVVGNKPEIAELLIDYLIKEYSSNCVYIEFRNFFDLDLFRPIFKKKHFSYQPHLNYLVKTDSLPLIKKRLSKSKLRQIQGSLRNGAVISDPVSEDEISSFYFLLKKLYHQRIRKPLPSEAFFLKFYQSKEIGRIFLIKKGNDVIGGIVCPIFENKIIYEWYICGNDNLKSIHPGVLATWAPIEYAANNGMEKFDFMGAGSPDKDYGVRDFKSKFGGELVENGRYIRINKPLFYNIGKLGLTILSHLNKV